MGKRSYFWFAAIAAWMTFVAGCASQASSPPGPSPQSDRWWTTTSPPPSEAAPAAAQSPSGPNDTGADLPGQSSLPSTTGAGRLPAGLKTPSRTSSSYEQLSNAVTQNPVSKAVGGAVGRSATWVKTQTASLRMQNVDSAPDTISLAHKSPAPGASLYVAMARLNEQGGKVDKAISLYEQALAKEPDSVDAMLGLAHLLDREGRFDLALKQYLKASRAHPNDPSVHNDLGLCYARSGAMDDAIQELTQAVTLRPHSVLYRNNIATVLVELGRNDEAVEHLIAAHGESVGHYNLGVLLHQRGHDDLAVEQFATALRINPKLVPARDWLARLDGGAVPAGRSGVAAETLASRRQAAEARWQDPPAMSQDSRVAAEQGPAVKIGSLRGVPENAASNSAEVPGRPVHPETWRAPAGEDGPVHLPALQGPEQAVLPPTPGDLQRYPTSGLPNGPRPY